MAGPPNSCVVEHRKVPKTGLRTSQHQLSSMGMVVSLPQLLVGQCTLSNSFVAATWCILGNGQMDCED